MTLTLPPPLTDANRQIESAFLEISMRKLGLEKKQEEENSVEKKTNDNTEEE